MTIYAGLDVSDKTTHSRRLLGAKQPLASPTLSRNNDDEALIATG